MKHENLQNANINYWNQFKCPELKLDHQMIFLLKKKKCFYQDKQKIDFIYIGYTK